MHSRESLIEARGKITRHLRLETDVSSSGVDFLLRSMVFNVFPTIFEIGLVSLILGKTCGLAYSVIATGTIAVYVAFTVAVTQWR